MSSLQRSSSASEKIKHHFKCVDNQGNGLMDQEDLKRTLSALEGWAEKDSKALLDVFGKTYDGHIKYIDFLDWVWEVNGNSAESEAISRGDVGKSVKSDANYHALEDIVASLQDQVRSLSDSLAEVIKKVEDLMQDELQLRRENKKDPRSPARLQDIKELFSHERLPNNYDEAFDLIGGTNKLEKHAAFSESMQRKYELHPSFQEFLPGALSAALTRSVVINYQDYADTLDELLERVEAVHDNFQLKLKELAVKTHGKACFPPLKGRSRCEAKSRFKYADTNGGIAWYRLSDVLRDTLLYDDLDAMYAALEVLDEDPDIKVIEFNDRYQKPLDRKYRDLQLSVRFQGVVCEIQLNTLPMAYVKEFRGHRDFEVKRELLAAADAGDVERCRNIIAWGKDNLGQDAVAQLQEILNDPQTGLVHKAAERGLAEIISVFLQHKADANATDHKKRTPLHLAVAGAHERATWALLSRGKADPSLKDEFGITPVLEGLVMLRSKPDDDRASRVVSLLAQRTGAAHLAEVRKRLPEVLNNRYVKNSDLCSAAFDGDAAKVREHLRQFANPDSTDKDGLSALRIAVQERRTQVVKVLLEANASVDLSIKEASRSEKPLLYIAVECGDLEVAQLLLDVKAVAQGNEYNAVQKVIMDKAPDLFEMFWKAGMVDVDTILMSFRPQSLGVIKGAERRINKYSGIASGLDDCLYCAPHDADKVLVIDTKAQKLSWIAGAGHSSGKYQGIALGDDGCLYCAPYNADKVLVVDPKTRTLSFIEGSGSGGKQYIGVASAPDGCLYFAPFDACRVMVVDPRTRTLSFIDGVPHGDGKYFGIANGSDGCLYCSPFNADRVLVVNPKTRSLSYIEGVGSGSRKYFGIAQGPDGCLYTAPCEADNVLVVDPKTQNLSFIGGAGKGCFKYYGITSGPDGCLYCAPCNADKILVVDPRARRLSFTLGVKGDESKYDGIAPGPDGCLYCAPHKAEDVLVLKFVPGRPEDFIDNVFDFCSSERRVQIREMVRARSVELT